MDQGELWKERLAFASGNILTWGALFLTLWPTATRLQTDMHIHFWTLFGIGRSPGSPWLFLGVTALLALAGLSMTLAIVHILCRGLWLALTIETTANAPAPVGASDFKVLLDRICLRSYGAVFFVLGLGGYWILGAVALLIVSATELLLVSYLSLSLGTAYVITRVLLCALLLCIYIAAFKKRKSLERFRGSLREISWYRKVGMKGISIQLPMGLLLTFVMFFMVWFAVMESCYKLELKLNKNVFHQTSNDVLEVYVTLGGATSAASEGSLKLLDAAGNPITDALILNDIGEGQYAAYLACTSLAPGRYKVVVEYPHVSFSSLFPFFQRTNVVSSWLLVAA